MLETRALIVDDDLLVLGVLGEGLRQAVRNVDQESSGRRALALFEAYRHPVVVLDLKMPEMNGIEVLEQIRRLEPRTQVIIVTGFASKENAIKALNLHAFRLLEKPITLEQLHQVVAEAWAQYQNPNDGAESSDAEIEALYQDVARLSVALQRDPDDPQLRAAYAETIARLRSAQALESERATRAFQDSLALKKGAGYASVEAARHMLGRG